MSYSVYEGSSELGAPVELYEFVCGTTDEATYRYTNLDRDFVANGVTWEAIPISRGTYKSSGKTERASLDIAMPLSAGIAEMFTAFPPTQVIGVTIWSGHLTDPDQQFRVVWVGRLMSNTKGETELTLTCESTLLSLKRQGLRRTYSYGCPYVLYDARTCRADQSAATVNTTVVAIEGSVVTFEPGWAGATALSKYAGGMVRWMGPTGYEYRTIVSSTDDDGFYITTPLRGMEVGTAVEVILGCDHTVADCRNLHNNVKNYGGQPWIPIKNPVRYHPFW